MARPAPIPPDFDDDFEDFQWYDSDVVTEGRATSAAALDPQTRQVASTAQTATPELKQDLDPDPDDMTVAADPFTAPDPFAASDPFAAPDPFAALSVTQVANTDKPPSTARVDFAAEPDITSFARAAKPRSSGAGEAIRLTAMALVAAALSAAVVLVLF
jgi:hypothetical protein